MEATRVESLRQRAPGPKAHRARIRLASRDAALRRLLALGDMVAILVALALASLIFAGRDTGSLLSWGFIPVAAMIVIFKLYGLYDRDVKRLTHSTLDDIPRLAHAVLVGNLLLWLFARYTPMPNLGLWELLVFDGGVIVFVCLGRVTVRALAGRVMEPERALVIGTEDVTRTIVAKLRAHPEYRTDVVGALVPVRGRYSYRDGELPVLGTIADLAEIAARQEISRVVFSGLDAEERELEELLRQCRALSLKVSLLPRLSDVLGPAIEIDDVEGVTVLGVNPPWLPRSSRAIKRTMDLFLATGLLIAGSPLLLLIAIAIKLDSPGPVLFSQPRIGKDGLRFRLWKLRTMVETAEQCREELLAASIDPDWLKLEFDPRVTRVGRWLRRLSLDELPQLWNVLRGEMSMVGPRPLIPQEDARVRGWARDRLDLTPGITGYWQVLGRTRIPFEEMVKLDYLYVMNWSLWEDVRLMLRTIPAVFAGKGAN